jgi:hypothetical protein
VVILVVGGHVVRGDTPRLVQSERIVRRSKDRTLVDLHPTVGKFLNVHEGVLALHFEGADAVLEQRPILRLEVGRSPSDVKVAGRLDTVHIRVAAVLVPERFEHTLAVDALDLAEVAQQTSQSVASSVLMIAFSAASARRRSAGSSEIGVHEIRGRIDCNRASISTAGCRC